VLSGIFKRVPWVDILRGKGRTCPETVHGGVLLGLLGSKMGYRAILAVVLLISLAGMPVVACETPAPMPAPGWYDCAWGYRESITIDRTKVAGDLAGFPVLVSLASDAGLPAHARPDGGDILFTASDGITEIPHEIESYTGTDGTLIAWVKVPHLSSGTDTLLYLYYGNPEAPAPADWREVWSGGYRGVWHLGEETGALRMDSTRNANHLSDTHGVALSPVGRIGGAADFTAAQSQRLTITDAAQTGLDVTGPLTLEAWVRTDRVNSGPYYFIEKAKGSCSEGDPPYYFRLNDGDATHERENALVTGTCHGDGQGINGPMASVSAGTWYHLTAVSDGSALRVYRNGVQTNSRAYSSGIFDSDGDFNLGGRRTTQFFDGQLDEVRVSAVARSAPWIRTQFNNQNSPSGFFTVGAVEENPCQAFSCPADTYSLVTADGETGGCVAITNEWAYNETLNDAYDTIFVSFTAADSTRFTAANVGLSVSMAPVTPQFSEAFDPASGTTAYTFAIELPANFDDVQYLYVSAFGTVQEVTGGVASPGMDVSALDNPIEYIIRG
jgi:hypothetical protein